VRYTLHDITARSVKIMSNKVKERYLFRDKSSARSETELPMTTEVLMSWWMTHTSEAVADG
jgi:hypothetical protein